MKKGYEPGKDFAEWMIQTFGSFSKSSINDYLRDQNTTLSSMKELQKILKRSGGHAEVFLTALRHENATEKYFTPADLALFYRGKIQAVALVGLGRELYWSLESMEGEQVPESTKDLMKHLYKRCSVKGDFETFQKAITLAYAGTAKPEKFLFAIEPVLFPYGGNFKGRCCYELAAKIANWMHPSEGMATAKLAIFALGACMQLNRVKPRSAKGYDEFLVATEAAFDEIRALPLEGTVEFRKLISKKLSEICRAHS